MTDRFDTVPNHVLARVSPDIRKARVAPDVSVLLAALLDLGSQSNQLFAALSDGVVVLGAHTEDTAARLLRANAPQLVADYADGLVQLGSHAKVSRARAADLSGLPDWTARLSLEYQWVLADAIEGKANIVLTHDSEFFQGQLPGIGINAPSGLLWSPNDPRNIEANPFSWTFLGLFVPNWSTEAMRGTQEEFYILDIPGTAEFFYDTHRESFVFHWYEGDKRTGSLSIPQVIEWRSTNFVAVAVDEQGALIFANGRTRSRNIKIGTVPPDSRIYPFNNSHGGGQINGHMQFRVAGEKLRERRIRRLWKSRTLRLSDGELRFHELVSTTRLMIERGTL